ncbi:MAG: hypothetical protein WDM76_07880 [Limisphaerales bacterium]
MALEQQDVIEWFEEQVAGMKARLSVRLAGLEGKLASRIIPKLD